MTGSLALSAFATSLDVAVDETGPLRDELDRLLRRLGADRLDVASPTSLAALSRPDSIERLRIGRIVRWHTQVGVPAWLDAAGLRKAAVHLRCARGKQRAAAGTSVAAAALRARMRVQSSISESSDALAIKPTINTGHAAVWRSGICAAELSPARDWHHRAMIRSGVRAAEEAAALIALRDLSNPSPAETQGLLEQTTRHIQETAIALLGELADTIPLALPRSATVTMPSALGSGA